MTKNGNGSQQDNCIQKSATKHTSNNPLERVRNLNDQLRRTGTGGMIVMTRGIEALEASIRGEVFQAVQCYDDFNLDNDPYTEHDFGKLKVRGHKIFWKIDYYAPDLIHGSADPANADGTTRILTVMLAHEY